MATCHCFVGVTRDDDDNDDDDDDDMKLLQTFKNTFLFIQFL